VSSEIASNIRSERVFIYEKTLGNTTEILGKQF